MKIKKIKRYYRQRLPHLHPIGACFFITFRLKGSIPKVKLYELRLEFENRKDIILKTNNLQAKQALYAEQKLFFAKYDQLLDTIKEGPHFLRKAKIASIITTEIHRYDKQLYDLIAYTIMSNHVHLLIDTNVQLTNEILFLDFDQIDFEPLHRIMRKIKGVSARYANIELGRSGTSFWQKESYDHFVRNEREFNNIIAYILNNPVNAGIIEHWEDYPFSYLKNHPVD